jgi:hypothetical protein
MHPVHVCDILSGVTLGQVPTPLVTLLACIVFYAWKTVFSNLIKKTCMYVSMHPLGDLGGAF